LHLYSKCIFVHMNSCIYIHISYTYICIHTQPITFGVSFLQSQKINRVPSSLRLFRSIYVSFDVPHPEEIRLKTITTAETSNKFPRDFPYISNTFSREFPEIYTSFFVCKRSLLRHSKDLSKTDRCRDPNIFCLISSVSGVGLFKCVQVSFDVYTAHRIWSVISPIPKLNRVCNSVRLFRHVPLKRDQLNRDCRIRLKDTPNAIGCTYTLYVIYVRYIHVHCVYFDAYMHIEYMYMYTLYICYRYVQYSIRIYIYIYIYISHIYIYIYTYICYIYAIDMYIYSLCMQ